MVQPDLQIGLGIGIAMGIGIGMLIMIVMGEGRLTVKQHLNPKIKKSEPKVVDKVTLAAVSEKSKDGKPVAFCRCWRSKNFPYCDGSHATWNGESGDNIGPLLVMGN